MEPTEIYLVLADHNRKRILDLVLGSERTVTDLVRSTRLHQPLVSHHLRVLRDAGLVAVRREGRFRFYAAASKEVERLLAKVDADAVALLSAAAPEEGADDKLRGKPAHAAATLRAVAKKR